MHKYRLDLQYVGTRFQGWQSQPSATAVQDHLNKILNTILGETVRTVGASRTDSGVHACHQVVSFEKETPITNLPKTLKGLDALLPPDFGVLNLEKVDLDFHPIFSARAKIYCYRLWLSHFKNPFWEPFVWTLPQALEYDQLLKDAIEFQGEHDFSSFCNIGSSAPSKVRTIFDIKIIRRQHLVEIWLLGNGFLKQMVRNIVGTIVDRASGRLSTSIQDILLAQDRTVAGITAPAKGLTLSQIYYDKIPELADYLQQRSLKDDFI